jgi:hypothetical protein
MKYIGALHIYIRDTLLLFNPTSLDEVCVQATHLENMGKHVQEDPTKKPSNLPHKQFKIFKMKVKKIATVNKEEGKTSCIIARRMVMMMNIVGNYIQRRGRNSLVERGRQRPFLQCNKILVPIQETKKISQRLEYKVKIPFMLVQIPIMNLMMMKERGMNYFT